MKVEKINTLLIKPYWRNPRVNNETVNYVMKSITDYGFNSPIMIDKDNVIITGHTRYKAVSNLKGKLGDRVKELEQEGKKELADNLRTIDEGFVFIFKALDLTPEQVKRFRILDNKIAEASGWDTEFLKSELREIDLDKMIGFSKEELDILLDTKIEVDFNEYTPEDIAKIERYEERKYDTMGKQDLVELMCPYCHQKFSLREDEILDRNKYMRDGNS